MSNDRYLLVVSGPSGIGKDTVVQKLIEAHPGEIELSVSATTRPPRDYEVNGQHYFFLSEEAFLARAQAGDLVEHTNYAGNYYGTLKSEVDRRIGAGKVCVLVIEINGAANVKKMYPDCTTVFIVAPSLAEHERRLRGRGSECEETMAQRMEIAKQELLAADQYDYQLVNDDAAVCAGELYGILRERLAE